MKRILLLLIPLLFFVSLGVSEVVEISNYAELKAMEYVHGGDYILVNDIDATDTGDGFQGVGSKLENEYQWFRYFGTFDGDGHKIKNLLMNVTDGYGYDGMFRTIEGGETVIKNLGLENINYNYCRGGGLVGGGGDATIENCFVTGTITANEEACGLAYGLNGVIKNCYTRVRLSTPFYACGFYAFSDYEAQVSTCYSACELIANRKYGFGEKSSSCLYDSDIAGEGVIDSYATGKTTAQMKSILTYPEWAYQGVVNVAHEYDEMYDEWMWRVTLVSGDSFQYDWMWGFDMSIIINGVAAYVMDVWSETELTLWDYQGSAGNGLTYTKGEGWDFENVWAIDPAINDGYPYLRNVPPSGTSPEPAKKKRRPAIVWWH